MNPILSLFSGIIAAFTPCVIVLFPLVLYRFFGTNNKKIKEYIIFLGGFILAYIIFGYAITELFTSGIQEGIKLGFGIIFVTLGILALLGKINPMNLPVMKNPFLLGSAFALLISISPCSLPYLGLIVSINATGQILINILFFGIGIIMPSILFAFIGNKILNLTKKHGKILEHMNKLMNVVLVISGIYLMLSIKMIHEYDIYVVSGLLLVVFAIIIKAFFLINSKKDFLKPSNILLFAALIIIVLTAMFNCKGHIEEEKSIEEPSLLDYTTTTDTYTCGADGNVTKCEICSRCLFLFSSAVLIGGLGIYLNHKFQTKKHPTQKVSLQNKNKTNHKKEEDEKDDEFY